MKLIKPNPLVSVFIKTDYRDKEQNTKKKLFGILLAYLVSNFFLSFTYSSVFDMQSYIIFAITASMFLIAFIVMNDFDNLFLANKSYDLLSSLPVKSSEIFSAKFFSALLYLLFFFISVVIPQIFFLRVYDLEISAYISFFFINFLFSFSSAGVLLLIYIFALNKFSKRAGIVINIIQLLFFIFVIYTSTLPSRSAGFLESGEKKSLLNIWYVKFTPQYFFSEANNSSVNFFIIIIFSVLINFFLFKILGKNYLQLLEKVNALKKTSGKSKKKLKLNFINKLAEKYIKGNAAKGSYKLAKWELSNSKFLRMKYIPMIFLPLSFIVLGFFLPDTGMFVFKSGSNVLLGNKLITLLSPTITLMLIMSSRILISNTKILDEHSSKTNWIFESLPVMESKKFIIGTNFFVYMNFILPVILLLLILLTIRVNFSTAALNVIFISSAIIFLNSLFNLFDKDFPFTLESNKFNSASKFLEIIISIVSGVAIFIVQIFVFQNVIFVLSASALFILISYILNRS